MGQYNAYLKFVGGGSENIKLEAPSLEGAIQLITKNSWFTQEDISVNMQNVLDVKVTESDGKEIYVHKINF